MSRPTNYIGVKGVKSHNFNLIAKITEFKHPRNLPTVQYANIHKSTVAPKLSMLETNMYSFPSAINWSNRPLLFNEVYISP